MTIKKCYRVYFSWLMFTAVVYIFTNAASNIDVSLGYNFNWSDVLYTYGFVIFIAAVEIALLTLVLIGVRFMLEKWLKRRLERPTRFALLGLFFIACIHLFVSIWG